MSDKKKAGDGLKDLLFFALGIKSDPSLPLKGLETIRASEHKMPTLVSIRQKNMHVFEIVMRAHQMSPHHNESMFAVAKEIWPTIDSSYGNFYDESVRQSNPTMTSIKTLTTMHQEGLVTGQGHASECLFELIRSKVKHVSDDGEFSEEDKQLIIDFSAQQRIGLETLMPTKGITLSGAMDMLGNTKNPIVRTAFLALIDKGVEPLVEENDSETDPEEEWEFGPDL